MSDIASRLHRSWLELAWGVFAAANLVVMFRMDSTQTIPFHFVWVSLTLVYGFRTWAPGPTLAVSIVVCGLTASAFLGPIMEGRLAADESTEVPLMASMFLVMVWHARRRVAAMEEVRRLASSERRLWEREREFIRDASHNLRTPITVARGYAELIRAAHDGTQTSEDASVVLGELQKLTRISERLLTLAQSEQPDFLRRVDVDLEDLLNRAASRWTVAARRRWQVELGADGHLSADAEQLEAALDALIENAIDATDEDGQILLRSRVEDDVAVIEVVDDGVGIRPEHLTRVFDRFWRAHGEPARVTSGNTGLGLAIVKAIVEAHGGTVTAASDPGAGTTFTVRLPGFRSAGTLMPAVGGTLTAPAVSTSPAPAAPAAGN